MATRACPGGTFGRALHVELDGDRVRARHEPLDPRVVLDYIGGVGLGAYLLWRHAPAGVDPLAPEAPLLFVFSPLLGTPLTTTAKFAVVCKSPLTGRIGDSLSSSRFALRAKKLGVDAIVITGALDRLSVLELDERLDRCRVRPCPQLAGKTPAQVTALLGEGGRGVAAIGEAGERQVLYATISNDGRHAGRGGSGALMGAKMLKAITVRGSQTPEIAAPARVIARARELAARSLGVATDKYRLLGTAANLETLDRLRVLPVRNFQDVSMGRSRARRLAPDGGLSQAGQHVRDSCAGCTIGCDHRYGGTRIEYETQFALAPLIGVDDPKILIAAARACDALGLDTISTGGTIAFAMECVERGLVTGDGWPRFGDDPRPLIEMIARREGPGEILSLGTRRAAAVLGQGSEAFACQVKGLELPGYEPRAMQTMALGLCVAARGADHNRSGAYQADLRADVDRYRADVENAPGRVIETEDHAALYDSLILCKFLRGAIPAPFVEGPELLAMVTGLDHDEAGARAAAARIAATRHLLNLREGWSPAEDTLPARFTDEALGDGARLARADLQAMVAGYHAARGRDASGRLRAELVRDLDLGRWLDLSGSSCESLIAPSSG